MKANVSCRAVGGPAKVQKSTFASAATVANAIAGRGVDPRGQAAARVSGFVLHAVSRFDAIQCLSELGFKPGGQLAATATLPHGASGSKGECRSPVLRLCSVKNWAKAQGENWVILNRQKEVQETQCTLFPICCRLPKLDVAGSNPVSRSIFSMTWDSSTTSFTPFHSVKR